MSVMERIRGAVRVIAAWGDSYVVEPDAYKRERLGVDAPTDEEVQRNQERFSNHVGAGLLAYTIGFTLLACYEAEWINVAFWVLMALGTGCLLQAHRIQISAPWD
jgi:uncharacterized membrane protein (DUF485 family)